MPLISSSTMGALDDDRSQAPSVPDDEATTTAENEDTVDTREEQQDVWAQAEGYTPLTDIQYTSLMVSLGPSDDEDEDDNNDEADGRSAAGDVRTVRGAFFVNPSAFSADPDDEEGHDHFPTIQSSVEESIGAAARLPDNDLDGVDDLFQDIAGKALSLLDEEYERTLKGARPPSSWQDKNASKIEGGVGGLKDDNDAATSISKESSSDALQQEQEDLKIIAAAFDERKEVELKNGFVAEWDILPSINPTTTPLTQTAASSSSVDTDAVRKVVQSLSEKMDNPFQKKFAEWQERQQSLPLTHDLIPTTPFKAFRRNTEKAKAATASLTRSATLAEALLLLREEMLLPSDVSTLLIDVVGVDHVECESIERIQSTFRPIIRWIGAWKGCRYEHIHLRLIGRDLSSGSISRTPVDLLTPQTSTVLQSAFATCHLGVYHTWLSEANETAATSKGPPSPHLAIAYNAGIWGYNEWQHTIQYLSERTTSSIPFVITAYTLEECEDDFEVIKTRVEGNGSARVLWEAQRNPFGSKTIRETKSSSNEYRENAAWQAWLLGRNSE